MIAIWGANGFIGRNLAKNLAETGTQENVKLFSRNFDGFPLACPTSFSKYEHDFTNPKSYINELKSCKTIILLVTSSYARTNLSDFNVEIRQSVDPYKGFFEALNTNNIQPEHIIYASSGGAVYGAVDTKAPLSEKYSCAPSTPYGKGKLLIEEAISKYAQDAPWRYTLLRIANPLGGQGNGLVNSAFNAIQTGKQLPLFSRGKSVRDYFDVKELAQAITMICNHVSQKNQIYNIGSGQGTSVMDVIACVNNVTGKKVPFTLQDGDDPIPYNVLDCRKIENNIGWKAQNTLETIIKDMWQKR